MAKSSMKSNKSVRKVSQRALDHQKEVEEKLAAEEAAKEKKKKQWTPVLDALYSSGGGLLTMVSLLFGLYGILSIPATWLCYKGLKKNKDYGWRGVILPGICIVLNVLWLAFQIAMLFSADLRVWFYNFTGSMAQ